MKSSIGNLFNRYVFRAKGIPWRENGFMMSGGCLVLIIALVFCERYLQQSAAESNSRIVIAAEEANDSDEILVSVAPLSNDDSEYVDIIFRYLSESYSGFSALVSQYPAAAPKVWLSVLDRIENESPNMAGELIQEFARYYPNDVDFLFALAKWQAGSDNLKAAIETYRRILSLDEYHQASQINLGLALLKEENYERAVVELDKAIDMSSGERKGKSLSAKASGLMMLSRYDEAEKNFQRSIEYRPTNAAGWRKLAIAQLHNGKPWHEVLLTLDRSITLQPDYLLARYNRAQMLWLMQDRMTAREELQDIVKVAPEFAPAHWSLAHINVLSGRKSSAKKSVQWLQQQTLTPQEQQLVDWMLVTINNDSKEIARFMKIVSENKASVAKADNPLIHGEVELLYHMLQCSNYRKIAACKKLNELADFNKAFDLNDFNDAFLFSEWWLRKASLAAANEDYPQAIEILNQLIQQAPSSDELQHQLGRWLMAADQPQDAIPYLQTAVDLAPNTTQYRLSLALGHVRADQPKQAELAYEALLKLAPNHKIAHFNYALLLQRQERIDEAEQQLLETLSIDANYANAQLKIARLYLQIGDYDKALPYLKSLTEAAPARRRYRELLIDTYMNLEDYQRAYNETQRLVALNPDNTKARLMMFEVLRVRGELRKAGDIILNLPSAAYTSAVITKIYNLGVKALGADDLALAELLNRQVLELDPTRDKAMVNLSATLMRSERYQETAALLTGSSLLAENEKLLLNLAEALYRSGEYEQFIALLDTYVEMRDENESLVKQYADANEKAVAVENNIH